MAAVQEWRKESLGGRLMDRFNSSGANRLDPLKLWAFPLARPGRVRGVENPVSAAG